MGGHTGSRALSVHGKGLFQAEISEVRWEGAASSFVVLVKH